MVSGRLLTRAARKDLMLSVFILGCGYTGRRVARRLLARGVAVTATTRDPERLADLAALGAKVLRLDLSDDPSAASVAEAARGTAVLLSVPTLRLDEKLAEPTPHIVAALGDRPSRLVYLSTSGVYGAAKQVDETTPPAPATERQRLRWAAEEAVRTAPCPSLILRPAAIYGPGRGVHWRLARGEFRLLGDGSNYVSRIHVDDLAATAEAALLSRETGAYPVADDCACMSREIVEHCCRLLGIPVPPSASAAELSESRRSNRRVDGGAIRRLLGVELSFPSYREGTAACLEAEARDNLPLP